jgi:hypothetical protein
VTVPISTRKKGGKKKLVQTNLLSKAVLANLADLCTEKVCTQHTDTERNIYIYYIVANFTTKWDFFFQINFFFFTLGITPTVINLSVKTLSLSLSLLLSLSLCDLCVCLQLQRYLGQFHKVYNFEQQQCNSSEAVRLASASSVKN